jgi:hypothetical protein
VADQESVREVVVAKSVVCPEMRIVVVARIVPCEPAVAEAKTKAEAERMSREEVWVERVATMPERGPMAEDERRMAGRAEAATAGVPGQGLTRAAAAAAEIRPGGRAAE